jgi:PhzF family phenazine biosynthesis protein
MAQRKRPFAQVDVFTERAYFGNALAVVLDGEGLSDDQMQRFAQWTNLSETTFVLPPTPEGAAAGADYRVRIFTPAYEMPFAGHPTLGSCHAWLAQGGTPKNSDYVVQECKVGLVKVMRHQNRLAFAAPALRRTVPSEPVLNALLQALGLSAAQVLAAQHLNNGPDHFGILIDSVDTVLHLQPDHGALRPAMIAAGCTGVGVVARASAPGATALIGRSNRESRAFGERSTTPSADADLEVRFFFDHGHGIGEDPATGSFNASLAQWLMAEGHMSTEYTVAQGTCIGRESRLHLQQDSTGQVWVGGHSVTCIHGEVSL